VAIYISKFSLLKRTLAYKLVETVFELKEQMLHVSFSLKQNFTHSQLMSNEWVS
jgi:hypothetical protein